MSIYPLSRQTRLHELPHQFENTSPLVNSEEVQASSEYVASLGASSSTCPTQTALNRLEILFQRKFSFSITSFYQAHCASLSPEEEVRFLSALLYRIYLNDVDAPSEKLCGKSNRIEFFCWQILAETISLDNLSKVLSTLPSNEKARLAILAFAHYREGSFFLVEALERESCPMILQLIDLLKAGPVDTRSLTDFSADSLSHLFKEHRIALESKASALCQQMQTLLPLILRLSETRKEGQYALNAQYQADVSEEDRFQIDLHCARETARIKNQFGRHANSFGELVYDEADFLRFLETFGTHNLKLPDSFGIPPNKPFLETLGSLAAAYATPLTAYKIHIPAFHKQLDYLSRILSHVRALKTADEYVQGAEQILFGLPTYNKDLSKLSWLPSMASNIRSFCTQTIVSPQELPVFVFDQSPEPLFSRNAAYIERLNCEQKTAIVTYSKEQILKLGYKLDLGILVDTTKTGHLGYGGARNAIYMLTPILKDLYHLGMTSPEDVLAVPDEKLQQLFHQNRLSNRWVVHMGDDDLQIPYASFLCDLLLAQENQGKSFVKYGEFIGRTTNFLNSAFCDEFFDLEKILENPLSLYEQTSWTNERYFSGMCGALRSFGFSMLPFGAEEGYSAEEERISSDIRPPAIHLAGRRLPTQPLPQSPIIGIAEKLTSFLPYFLQVQLVTDLIEPDNKLDRSILPWKKKETAFGSLNAVFEALAGHENETAMRLQLLNNYMEAYTSPTSQSLARSLSLLNSHDVDAAITAYLKKHPGVLPSEREELEKCAQVFEQLKQDSYAFSTFNEIFLNRLKKDGDIDRNALLECQLEAEEALKAPLASFSITQSVLLTLQTIVGGEIHETVREILQENGPSVKRTRQG